MFHIPYRWLPRTCFANLRSMYYDLTNGLHNLRRWIPVIWYDCDFDWDYLAKIMETKLRWMVKDTEDWHVLGVERNRRQMLICAELLKRLREDDYRRNAKVHLGESTLVIKAAELQQRNDMKYLGLVLGKYLNHWWD